MSHQGNLNHRQNEQLRTLLRQVSWTGSSISRHAALDLLMLLPQPEELTTEEEDTNAMTEPVKIEKPIVYPYAVWQVIEIGKGRTITSDRHFDMDLRSALCVTSIHAIVEQSNGARECAIERPSTMDFIENSIIRIQPHGPNYRAIELPLSFIQTHIPQNIMDGETYFSRGMRSTRPFPAEGMQAQRGEIWFMPSPAPLEIVIISSMAPAKEPVRVTMLYDGFTQDDPYQLESDRILARSTVIGPEDRKR